MKRREAVKTLALAGAGSLMLPKLLQAALVERVGAGPEITRSDFGKGFKWGAATAAYQIEGAWNSDGKGPSIWDTFSHKKGKIKNNENGDIACNFYNLYEKDIALLKSLHMDVFRFSTAWSRILPEGTGRINEAGLDFYKRVTDACLELGIEPWVTLYHWDLPQALEDKGGWANRDIIDWFSEYVQVVVNALGDRVNHWMIFNEPAAFTGLGYMTGTHAPGKKSLNKYPKTIHHVVLCQAEGGRLVKGLAPKAEVGTTFSMSSVHPRSDEKKDIEAAARMDALLNRLFIEPVLGMGYPSETFSYFKSVEKHMKDGDEKRMAFDFDFHGVQNYFRVVAKHSGFPPVLWANQVKPELLVKDKTELTEMGWEVYPAGIKEVIMKMAGYKGVKKIIVTENGCAFKDVVENGSVHDIKRTAFFQEYLKQVLSAKQAGAPVEGYFVWSLMDNFEWAEGYHPRFGLVHVDFETQTRTIKDSGLWFRNFLSA